MTYRRPPLPGKDLNVWARQMYEYLAAQSPVQGSVDPTPVLLPHQVTGQMTRAATDGILMYNPTTQKPEYSTGGAWEPLAIDDDITALESTVNGAWSTQSVTVTASSGAFTTVSGTIRWKVIGKTMFFSANVVITTAGTATGAAYIPLPAGITAQTTLSQSAAGRSSVTGVALAVLVAANRFEATEYDGTTAIADGRGLRISGVIEIV